MSWERIVGITARVDWRRRWVLNGRAMATGKPNAWCNDMTIMSPPILDAEYGDCGCSGCSSSMGTRNAVPYVSLVDVCTMRDTPARRHASATLNEPCTLVWI